MNNLLFGGMAVGAMGLISGAWGKMKGLFLKFRNIFIVSMDIDCCTLVDGLKYLLCDDCKPAVTAGYSYEVNRWWSIKEDITKSERNETIVRKMPSSSTMYFCGKKFFWIDGSDNRATITFIRGMFNKEKFLNKLLEKRNSYLNNYKSVDERFKSRPSNRFRVTYVSGSGESVEPERSGEVEGGMIKGMESGNTFSAALNQCYFMNKEINHSGFLQERPIAQKIEMAMSSEMKKAVVEAERWKEMEKWCHSRDIQWKRGWLLYGEPGNGKTTFVRTIARWINCPVYSIDLSSMTNESLIESWEMICNNQPCIALFEDIDAVFHGRKNITEKAGVKKGVSFDRLLNILDGVKRNNGIFTMITTNHLDKVDSAISGDPETGLPSRPGRIDRLIHVGRPSDEGKLKIAQRIMRDCPELIQIVMQESSSDTGAQFEERCQRVAIDNFWKDEKKIKEKEESKTVKKKEVCENV